MANQSIGKVEIGDIYEDTESGRRVKIGRLSVDQGSNEFFQKPVGRRGRATRLSAEDVATMLAQDKIVCDQKSAKTDLINYIRVLTESRNSIHDAEIERIKNRQKTEEMDRNKRIHAKVRRKVHVARLFWLLACGTMVATVFIASIPAPEPAKAEKTIAGKGQDYGIAHASLAESTYIEAMGSGSTTYGIVTDQNIVENGQETSGDSAIKENAMFTPSVSKTQPLHLRPLTYDKQTFYQTAIKTNDINGGETGVYLQNPNGNSLGVAANELVLAGGAGLGTIIIAAPDKYEDTTASATAKNIEQEQQQAATDSQTSSSRSSSDTPGGAMEESWNGFDSCDIDGNVIVGSYWYTKDASLKKSDLMRRVAVFNVKDVLSGSSDALTDLEAVQLNYQDFDNSYYNPVVSESPSSNGSTYWIGYTKETEDGDTGFFIRRYENNSDILMEDYENTFSTSDITGNSDPITNYTLFGDKLFYEQRGAIWVIDLSKLSANVEDSKRTIERENPVKIVDVIDMRASTTRDEQHIADLMGETVKPSCHYKVMTITTSRGVEYGIVFIDAQNGDLIYQPCYSMTTAASEVNNGGGTDSGSADTVTDLNETEIDRLREERNNKSSSSSSDDEDDSESDSKSSKKKNKNKSTSTNSGDITLTNYNAHSAKRITLAAHNTKTNLRYRQAADEETDDSSNDENDNIDSSDDSDNENADNDSVNDNSSDENEDDDDNQNIDDETDNTENENSNGNKSKKNLNSSVGDDNTSEDRGTALTGRIIIRKGNKNNVSIISYTIRGEQVVWLEEKQDDTKERSIRLSPVYYKNTSMEEKDKNADKNENTKSSLDGDNENGENANASDILKSGVNENAEDSVKTNENDNANVNENNNENAEEKAAQEAAAAAQADEAKKKQEEADALRAEQDRLANTPQTEFEDVE